MSVLQVETVSFAKCTQYNAVYCYSTAAHPFQFKYIVSKYNSFAL